MKFYTSSKMVTANETVKWENCRSVTCKNIWYKY